MGLITSRRGFFGGVIAVLASRALPGADIIMPHSRTWNYSHINEFRFPNMVANGVVVSGMRNDGVTFFAREVIYPFYSEDQTALLKQRAVHLLNSFLSPQCSCTIEQECQFHGDGCSIWHQHNRFPFEV